MDANSGTLIEPAHQKVVRRMTRLTNAFSKELENHEAMVALAIDYYNYCWRYGTAKTPQRSAPG